LCIETPKNGVLKQKCTNYPLKEKLNSFDIDLKSNIYIYIMAGFTFEFYVIIR